MAPTYDRAVALVGWHRWQDALVDDVTSGRVLDVGCGPAHLGPTLRRRGVGYVGVDRNAAMIRLAARRVATTGGVVVRADIGALPFRAGSFDVVVATGILGLLDVAARRAAVAEMTRVACEELRLLEPVHRPGAPIRALRSRVIALVKERPIELGELVDAGLEPQIVGPAVLAGVYSTVRAARPLSPSRR